MSDFTKYFNSNFEKVIYKFFREILLTWKSIILEKNRIQDCEILQFLNIRSVSKKSIKIRMKILFYKKLSYLLQNFTFFG